MGKLETEIRSVVGKWGFEKVNENGQYLVDVSAKRRLFLANTFQHKIIQMHKWMGNDRSHIDFIAIDNRLKRDVLEVMRRMFSGFDHFTVVAKVEMKKKWKFRVTLEGTHE